MTDFNSIMVDVVEISIGDAHVWVPRDWPATQMLEADLILGDPEGLTPGVASVVPVSSTQIRVNFLKPAVDNAALRSAGSYQITPSRNIYSVTPEAVANPTYVILTIDEQKTGEVYDMQLIRIEAA